MLKKRRKIMSLDETVVDGTLNADGTLELDRKPSLAPGRVRVIVQSAAAGKGSSRDLIAVMDEIRRDQQARGYHGRTLEEMQAEEAARREEDDEYDQRCQQLGAMPTTK
jgi:hypothetical protein